MVEKTCVFQEDDFLGRTGILEKLGGFLKRKGHIEKRDFLEMVTSKNKRTLRRKSFRCIYIYIIIQRYIDRVKKIFVEKNDYIKKKLFQKGIKKDFD